MSSGDGKKKKAGLTKTDHDLWQQVAKSVKPLKKDQHEEPVPEVKPTSGQAIMRLENEYTPPATVSSSVRPNQSVDRRTVRRLVAGREKIDRKIDLHGLTQTEAFAVLVRTVERSVLRQMKTVLVVTGKGGTRFSQSDRESAAYRSRSEFDMHGGVLKRMLPIWLEGGALAPLVESYGTAAPEHGGEGAYYVRLRRRKNKGDQT